MLHCCAGMMVSLLVLPQVALAQGAPRLELAASYQFLQPLCAVDCFSYPSGWRASAAIGLNTWLGIASEVGRNSKTVKAALSSPIPLNSGGTGTVNVDTVNHSVVYDVLAGPRVGKALRPAIRVFGSALFGIGRSAYLMSGQASAATSVIYSQSSTDWIWQPGAGLDVVIAPRWAIRASGDYRLRLSSASQQEGQLALTTGVVFRPFGLHSPTW